MSKTINISEYNQIKLPVITNEEAKLLGVENEHWSFSFAFHLDELRDVYLALKSYPFTDHAGFANYCKEINLPFRKTPWNKRRVLEYLNALKNFNLVRSDYSIKQRVFTDSVIGSPVNEKEKGVFYDIFFTYFRFKEIMTWFIDPLSKDKLQLTKILSHDLLKQKSTVLLPFSHQERFINSFLRSLCGREILFFDKDENNDFKRFWDVFVSWGKALGVIEKFSMKSFDYYIDDSSSFSCVYFPREDETIKLDMIQFIKDEFSSRYIRIPELVLKLCLMHRFTLERAKNLVIEAYLSNKDLISLERTSEVFIKREEFREKDQILFPTYKDSFVSHIVLRR